MSARQKVKNGGLPDLWQANNPDFHGSLQISKIKNVNTSLVFRHPLHIIGGGHDVFGLLEALALPGSVLLMAGTDVNY